MPAKKKTTKNTKYQLELMQIPIKKIKKNNYNAVIFEADELLELKECPIDITNVEKLIENENNHTNNVNSAVNEKMKKKMKKEETKSNFYHYLTLFEFNISELIQQNKKQHTIY